MYAVDDQRSLEHLYDEADNALKFIEPDSFVWAVVGNKADLRPEIEEATAKALSNTIGAKLYFYTSAKTGLNVKESMNAIVRALHRSHTSSGKLHSQSLKHPNVIKLSVSDEQSRDRSESNKCLPSFNILTVSGWTKVRASQLHVMYIITECPCMAFA